MERSINLVWQVDPYSSSIWEYDWISSVLSDFNVTHIVDTDYKICVDNAIIVSPGKRRAEYRNLETYVKSFREQGLKVGFIHLGDEWLRDPINFYKHVDFIFRNYYRSEAHKLGNCFYFPLGYKTGFCKELVFRDLNDRQYSWSFAGHAKGSRYKMLDYAHKIPGGLYHRTQMFNDPQGLSTKSYAELLNQTKFALCPRGNFSVDTFRFYEALEAGTIPIVEDRGGREVLKEVLGIRSFLSSGCHKPSYWLVNTRYLTQQSYWQQAYGLEFPCPRIYDWENLEALLAHMDVESTARTIQNWWSNYKLSLSKLMSTTIEAAFFR